MTDPEEILPDDLLAEALSPLRETAVPHEVQRNNRAAVARALTRTTRAPWYRRTVAVPLPLAIAATLAIVAASIAFLIPVTRPMADNKVESSKQDQVVSVGPKLEPVEQESAQPRWTVSRSYLSSIESLATTRVPLNSDL